MSDANTATPSNFIRQHIDADLAAGQVSEIVTRFPPEPNGYLHIGHAKSICLNFGIARDYGGRCFLRFDDTNPEKENIEFVEAIKSDVHWLGFDWEDRLTHASDYFPKLYQFAVELIENGKAFVCSMSSEEIRASRGTLTEPGTDSPYRNRSIEENLDLFERMRQGEFADGEHVLRARIDMASPNLNLRDPVLYRIRHKTHQNTGDAWCIYPMYDFTHCLSDAIEGITHSLCTLEFEDHRPLYDWVLENTTVPSHPRQIEFSRLSLDYTVMSKRMLTQLVAEGDVFGWDDPRMPTVSGLRRRGYSPGSIRDFAERIGITKSENRVEIAVLESCVREDLESHAPRRMAVVDPVKLVITDYPETVEEYFEAANHPGDASFGTRKVPFCREVYIERDDFMIDPPKKFFRLGPGREVRLKYAYLVTCTGYDTDEDGHVSVVYCTHDPDSRGGNAPDGRKVKGTIHWVSARHGRPAEVRLYDRLFHSENPARGRDKHFRDALNPESLVIADHAVVEPSLAGIEEVQRFQFERLGYFCTDPDGFGADKPVFNRTVTLRDSWARQQKRTS
ncbi:MAG: glutamine--tRNA ligase/YqeY domain fusion protein [Proteobacteria bacterium]|nr:MAG: glutamine--tRNA ligase/YqeY domain fusion protein [Pseudomonadota bacterium]